MIGLVSQIVAFALSAPPALREMVLPRFMVPDETQVVVPEATVRAAVEAMFAAVGMPADAATECAGRGAASGFTSIGLAQTFIYYCDGRSADSWRASDRKFWP